jgi:hypothetical protein
MQLADDLALLRLREDAFNELDLNQRHECLLGELEIPRQGFAICSTFPPEEGMCGLRRRVWSRFHVIWATPAVGAGRTAVDPS